MPVVSGEVLTRFATDIFASRGIPVDVAGRVAESLTLANLRGHDSHGIIRVLEYVDWVERGWVDPGARLEVVRDQPSLLVCDGHFGFGQVVGRDACELAIAKARRESLCVLTLRRAGHLGRIGEFMELAAEAGLVAFAFTNTHGGGVLVAPHGGCERRLSANPLGGGAPTDGFPWVLDLSTSTTAEGKIKVARSRRERMAPGLFVNGQGVPSTDPEEYYANPPGALLSMAGHKGYVLSMFCEVFAGALSGAGCSRAGVERVANGFFALICNPAAFAGADFFRQELESLGAWVKSSRLREGATEILLPGEFEARAGERRGAEGIDVEQATWDRLVELASARGVSTPAPVSS